MSSQRRRSILEAAERLFGHYGMQKTTIGDIAREAGIGVGSVYLEFSSKDAIVTELSRSRQRQIAGRMDAAARRGPPLRRLAAALEARVQALFDLAADGAHACDLVACTESAQDGRRHAPCSFSREEREVLEHLVEAVLEGRAEAIEHARSLAGAIERAYATLSPPWVFRQPRDEALRAARELNQLILFGLGDTEAPRRPLAPRRGSASR